MIIELWRSPCAELPLWRAILTTTISTTAWNCHDDLHRVRTGVTAGRRKSLMYGRLLAVNNALVQEPPVEAAVGARLCCRCCR